MLEDGGNIEESAEISIVLRPVPGLTLVFAIIVMPLVPFLHCRGESVENILR